MRKKKSTIKKEDVGDKKKIAEKVSKKQSAILKKIEESIKSIIKFNRVITISVSKKYKETLSIENSDYSKYIINNNEIYLNLFKLKSMIIFEDYDKAYFDMGQVSLLKLFQRNKATNNYNDFFDKMKGCFNKNPNAKDDQYIVNLLTEIGDSNFHGIRAAFNNLIQIPYFVEQYLILLMTTQKETFKVKKDPSERSIEDIEKLIQNKDTTYKPDFTTKFPTNNKDIISNLEVNKIKEKIKAKSDVFLKSKRDENSIDYLFMNYKNLIIFNSDDEKFVFYLPLSSFFAMIKPADSSYVRMREELQFSKINNPNFNNTSIKPFINSSTYFLGYYIKEVNSILVGSVRYIYDTIRDNLYFLFSIKESECSFYNVYLKGIYDKKENLFGIRLNYNDGLELKSAFNKNYLKFAKSYGLFEGLVNLTTPIIYIMSIYLDHLNIIFKHLLDLRYLNHQFKYYIVNDKVANIYQNYYEKNYKSKKTEIKKPESGASTESTPPPSVPSTPPPSPPPTASSSPETDSSLIKELICNLDLNDVIKNFVNDLNDKIITGGKDGKIIKIYNNVIEFQDYKYNHQTLPNYKNIQKKKN